MSARRARPLLLLVVGAGTLLLAGLPAGATSGQAGRTASSANEAEALTLLGTAARAARTRSWSGTQYVASWRDGAASSQVIQVRHDPGTGTQVRVEAAAAATTTVPAAALDEYLLAQLAERYTLSVTGSGTCSGRPAKVVEARRPDGRVAGRFWLDRDTGLPLRREVWDSRGRRLRSSAFVDLQVGPDTPAVTSARTAQLVGAPAGSGWAAPSELPGGYALFEAGRPAHDGGAVLHLAYSDGLSTVSVFSQPGTLGAGPGAGYTAQHVGDGTVWVHPGPPERLVWGGGGQVFTMVSNAGHDDLLAAVRALPRDEAVRDGPLVRLTRGLSRVGSWVNPLG